MTRPLLALAFLGCVAVASAIPAEVNAKPQRETRAYTVQGAEQWTIRSVAGRTYEISVYRPSAPPPACGYPVIYVLDADTAFAGLANVVRTQELTFGPTVVVGVGYPAGSDSANRTFDLSPATDPATLPNVFPGGWGPLGGAEQFFAFLQKELKPEIESTMAIDDTRQALFGHSMGGLFVLHVLFTHPTAFDTFVAGSPSIWWGNRNLLAEVAGFKNAQQKTGTHRRLLITVGALEADLLPEDERAARALHVQLSADYVRSINMVGNAAKLAADLQSLSVGGLQVSYVNFPNETHTSVIPAYLGRGARFALSGWFPP